MAVTTYYEDGTEQGQVSYEVTADGFVMAKVYNGEDDTETSVPLNREEALEALAELLEAIRNLPI